MCVKQGQPRSYVYLMDGVVAVARDKDIDLEKKERQRKILDEQVRERKRNEEEEKEADIKVCPVHVLLKLATNSHLIHFCFRSSSVCICMFGELYTVNSFGQNMCTMSWQVC